MWWFVFIPILYLAAPCNSLASCPTINGTSTAVKGEKCLKSPGSSPYDDVIFDLVNNTLREILRTGKPPKLPQLDPLDLTDLTLTLGEENGAYEPLTLHLESGSLEDLSTYVVNTAKFAIVGFAVVVDIQIPDIKLNAKYDMDGWFGDGLLYLYGNGTIDLSLMDVSLYVELSLGSHSGTGIAKVNCITLDYDVGDVKVNVTGLFGGGELGDFFNKVLQDAVPTIIEVAEDTLLGKVTCLLKDKANNIFQERGLTLNKLLCDAGVKLYCRPSENIL